MKENFEKSLRLTLDPSIEGGFSNHIADKGGVTNLGITLKTLIEFDKTYDYGDFDKDGDVDIEDIKLLDTIEEAAPIYQKFFWNVIKGDQLPNAVDYIIFDSAVNHGPRNAGKMLQRAINRQHDTLVVDGVIGAFTIEKCAEKVQETLIIDIIRERDIFYRKIVAQDASQEVFMKGWLNRLAQVTTNAKTF